LITFGLRYLRDTLELGQRVAAGQSFNVVSIIIEPRQTGTGILGWSPSESYIKFRGVYGPDVVQFERAG
jgi:hypothetical protein